MLRLIESILLLWLDAYYFLWAYTLRYSMPRRTSEMLANAIQGNIAEVKDFLLKELTQEISALQRESHPEGKAEDPDNLENPANPANAEQGIPIDNVGNADQPE